MRNRLFGNTQPQDWAIDPLAYAGAMQAVNAPQSALLYGGLPGKKTQGGLFSNFFDNPETGAQGWGGMALSGAQGLMGGFMGMKQYGMAKDQLKEAKRQFDLNYNTQRQTVNTQLEDRQRARVASNPGHYESVGDYMKKHGV